MRSAGPDFDALQPHRLLEFGADQDVGCRALWHADAIRSVFHCDWQDLAILRPLLITIIRIEKIR